MRAFNALCAERWAIEPAWLHTLAAVAQRHSASDSRVEEAREWTQRDFLALAGPGAQRLAGTHRSFINDGVGILPIVGPIFPRANMMTEMSGATSLALIRADFVTMLAKEDVRAMMLMIDSPGGAVSGIANFASTLTSAAGRKPIGAYVGGTGASAAYWIASAAGSISADRTAIVGSIGVIAAVPKQVAPDEQGEMWIEIVSTNAPNKRPDPQGDEGVAEVRKSLDALEAVFVGDVARARGVTAAVVRSDFGAGGVLVGHAARKAGMVDRIESQPMMMARLRLAARKGSPENRSAQANWQDEANARRLAALKGGDQEERNRRRLARLR